MITPTDEQQTAVDKIGDWLASDDPASPSYIRMFGHAGTGKSTLLGYMRDAGVFPKATLYGAYTGKASQVMRDKGMRGAQTLHSLIYKPRQKSNGQVEFILNTFDSPLLDAELLVIDECSMLSVEMFDDLISFGVPILVLGDPSQLPPPTNSSPGIPIENPDIMLNEIHRQARDSGIIATSILAREGQKIPYGSTDDKSVRHINGKMLKEYALDADVILCGTNKTRSSLNTKMRKLLDHDYESPYPGKGERIICRRNSVVKSDDYDNVGLGDTAIFNGQMGVVEEVLDERLDALKLKVSFEGTDHGQAISLWALKEKFTGGKTDMPWYVRKQYQELELAYAITVHLSQGSQWRHVALVDQSVVFRDSREKWLYVGITRAIDQLTMARMPYIA